MATKKIEIRPKGTGDYADVLYPKTSADMVIDETTGQTVAAHIAKEVGKVFNIEGYGLVGNGTTDNSGVLQSMLNTIGAGKETAVFPDGNFRLASNVTIPSNVALNFFKGSSIKLDAGIKMPASPFTHIGEEFNFSYRNSGLSGHDIYNSIFPNINHYDTIQGVTHIANGSTIEHAVGVSGYVFNEDADTNGVALFGSALVNVNNGAVWGVNTLLQDSDVRTAGTATGRKLYNELDFNVMNPGTEVVGLSIGGNSLVQPTNANGFIANTLGQSIGGKWVTAFLSMDFAANNALSAGRASTGANSPSQNVLFKSTDGASAEVTNTLRSESGGYVTLSSSGFNAFKVNAGNIMLDTGKGVIINGQTVLTDRQTTVANATNSTDVVTRFNELLIRLKAHGLIA